MYERLYLENARLLRHLAGRYSAACALDRAVDVEDLAQSGFFGLVKAAETFDESRGKSWASWAAWYVVREFENALGMREGRFTRAHAGAESLDRPISADDASGDTLASLLADDGLPASDEGLLRTEVVREVRAAVEALPEDIRETVRRVRLNGETCHGVAMEQGKTPGQVSALCRKAERQLYRNKRLRALADIDERTHYYAHKGVTAFQSDHTSVVEAAVLWREQVYKRMGL